MSAAKLTRIRCLAMFALAVLSLHANAQELVTNGGFEEPVISAPWVQRHRATTFGGWTVDEVGQGVVQVGSFGTPNATEGNQCMELNFFDACGISQMLTTQPGARYRITFMMAGQNNAGPDIRTMRVEWAGNLVATASWSNSGSGGQWQQHTYVASATSTHSLLRFFGETNVDGGPYLDAVSVVLTCSADYNGDQVVDFFDYLDFVDDLSSQALTSDFNGDGVIDFFDYLDFVQVFSIGC